MNLQIKRLGERGTAACSTYWIDDRTRLSMDEYIKWDGREKYNSALLEQVPDEDLSERTEIQRGNASPSADPALLGQAAQVSGQIQDAIEQDSAKDEKIAELEAQLAASQKQEPETPDE